MVLTRKRLLLIGFILILLLGIPATLFVVQQQQELRSRAEKSTTIYFQPSSTEAQPIVKKLGESAALDIYANPGNNLLSAVHLEILYDATKLSASDAAFVQDTQNFPNIITGPIYSPGKIIVTLTTGFDPTAVLNTVSKVGTITFTTIGDTGGIPTKVSYGPSTLVTSGGNTKTDQDPNVIDQFAENVLSSTTPAFINITNGITITPPPPSGPTSPTPTFTPSPTATRTPTPIIATGIPGATGPAGPGGPAGPAGPEGPAGPNGETATSTPTPEFTLAPTATETPGAGQQATAIPTMEPSGPGDTILGFGFAFTVLTIIGGILFFAL